MILDEALAEGRVYLPGIIAAELTSENSQLVIDLPLSLFLGDHPLVQADLQHWVSVEQLRATLLTKGQTVSTPDVHVA